MQNLINDVKFARAMNGAVAGVTNQNGNVIDTQGFDGVAFAACFGTILATAVTGIKVQEGTLANGADMQDLAGSAVAIPDTDSNKMLLTDIYRPRKRYVRLVVTRGTANAVIDGAVAMLYGGRLAPVTHDSSVSASEVWASPAEGAA